MKGILIVLFLSICSLTYARTYYVSTTGNNANDGLTTSTPWQTLQYAESKAVAAGDIIALKKGDTWSSTTAVAIKHGGASGDPVIWDGGLWGSGSNAVIKSSGNRSSGNDAIVNIITCSYVTFQNIAVDGNNTQTYGLVIGGHSGFSYNNQRAGISESYITIQDCSIINCGGGSDYRMAMHVNPYIGDIDHVTIQRCKFDGSSNHTLSLYPEADGGTHHSALSNVYVGYCTFTNYGLKKDGIASGILITNSVTNAVIEHNTITGTTSGNGVGIGVNCNEGTSNHYPKGIVIKYNDIRSTNMAGYPPLVIQTNVSGPVTPFGVDVFYNKLYSAYTGTSDGGGVWIVENGEALTGSTLRFYNNTIVTEGGTGLKDESGRSGILTLKNNIFINRGSNGDGNDLCVRTSSGSITNSNNSYWKTASSTQFTSVGGTGRTAAQTLSFEGTSVVANPLLMDVSGFDWHLQSGSPTIRAGVAISGMTEDIEGKTLNIPPSIGSHEASGGVAAVPVYVSSAIQNTSPAILEMTYNSSLAAIIPAASSFSVMVNSITRAVGTVTVSGTKVSLTLASAVVNGEVVTVSYTKPATNPLQTVSGGQAASITAQPVTNNVNAAVPVYVSSAIQNASPAILEMTYNSSLAAIIPAASSFSVMVNSVARSVSTVAVLGTKVSLTLSGPVVNGDVVTVSYTKPATNPLQTTSGGQAASITAQSVTNNVNAAVPVYVSSAIQNASPAILEMTYNSSLAAIIPAASSFSVMVNSVSRAVGTVTVSGTKVSLTLASAVVNGDVVTVSYTKPATNPLQTTSGGQAASITAQTVTNNVNAAVPVYVSSAIQNASPAILEMTYNSSLAAIIPAASSFSVMVNSVARSISTVAVSGTKVSLTLSGPVVNGDVVTVSYTKPATNPLQTTSGGQAAGITAQPVTNNVNAAVPVYVSSAIQNASPAILEMTYNSSLAAIIPAASSFSVMVNSITRAVGTVSVSGTKVSLTLASAVVNGEVVTVSYTKPATNPLQTTSGGQAASITAQPVTNNVNAAVPVYVSSAIQNASPAILEMTYNSSLAAIIPAASSFSVMVNSVARSVSTVAFSGTKVSLTLASAVVNGDVVTVSYTKPATNPLQTTSGGQAASITAQPVTNNVNAAVPVYVSSAIQNASPAILEMTYNSSLAAIIPAASSFSVMVNSVARSVSTVAFSGTKVSLTLASAVINGDVVTVSYTKPATNPLQTTSGGQAASITAQPVTNNVNAAVPVYVSSAIQNASPAILEMTYNSSLAAIIPAASSFSVKVNSVTRAVGTVTVTGTKVSLTLASVVVNGDVVTVSYTKPATNSLQTTSGGQAAGITAQPVTNNVNAAVPVYVSSAIQNASPAILEMTYNSSLAAIIPAASSFSVMVNSITRAVGTVTVSGTKVSLTLASAVVNGDVVTVSYTKPAISPLQTVSGGQAASITAQPVTNNVNAAVPVYVSSAIQNASPAILEMTYNSSLAAIIPAASSFSVKVNSVTRAVGTVTVTGTKVSLTLASVVVNGDVVTVSYTKPATNPLQTTSGGQAASITAQPVTNNVNAINSLPVIVVNFNKNIYSGYVGEIDATNSYDADGDTLIYDWTTPAPVEVSSTVDSKIKFLAPIVQVSKTLDFIVKISDGKSVKSQTVTVNILPNKRGFLNARIKKIYTSNSKGDSYPYNITDNNIETIWSSDGNDEWLNIELEKPFRVSYFEIAFQKNQRRETIFDIYGSQDSITWEPILVKAASCNFAGGFQVFDVIDTKNISEYSFLKLVGQSDSSDSLNIFSEFRVFGTPGLKEIKMTIYPNPAQEVINISVESNSSLLTDDAMVSSASIRIFDTAGKMVHEKILEASQNDQQIPINLKSGVYVILLMSHGVPVASQKLIVSD